MSGRLKQLRISYARTSGDNGGDETAHKWKTQPASITPVTRKPVRPQPLLLLVLSIGKQDHTPSWDVQMCYSAPISLRAARKNAGRVNSRWSLRFCCGGTALGLSIPTILLL
jgi:hypothetical protein